MKVAARAVPILLYHSVDETVPSVYSPYAVSPSLFDSHMHTISANGFVTLTVSELARHFRQKTPVPDRCVLVSIDDGLLDFGLGAMPVLQKYGLKATLFVVAGLVGKSSQWLEPLGQGKRPMLNWQQLRAFAGQGVEIGAHSLSHPQLDILNARQAAAEIGTSRKLLQDGLGQPVISFAYPHGYASQTTRNLVRLAGYECACRVRNAYTQQTEDQFGLSRINIDSSVTPEILESILFGTAGYPVAPATDRPISKAWRLARKLRKVAGLV